MNIDETGFHTLLDELAEENALACRGLLSVARVEFTDAVRTAAVTLGVRPVLRVNLAFIQAECATEMHVKALLVHEFLHVLLRHTREIRHMTPAINLALDAVINAMIHRKLGPDYSGFMSRYYAEAKGPVVLLRPRTLRDDDHYDVARGHHPSQPDFIADAAHLATAEWLGLEGTFLWKKIYDGKVVYEDVLEFVKAKRVEQWIAQWAAGGPVFLGNHAEGEIFDADDVPAEIAARLRTAAQDLAGQGILPLPAGTVPKPGDLSVPPSQAPAEVAWEKVTVPLLRRLIVPDPRGRRRELQPAWAHLPVLNTGDRRGLLRSLWNPLVGEIAWETYRAQPRGSVAVYLDVSGSMSDELQAVVALLHRFERHLRRPFWAFANTVEPALITDGKLQTRSTGGTSVACVVDHLRRTRPLKALIVTDGFVERLPSKDYSVPGVTVEVLLTAKGTGEVLQVSGWAIHRLPAKEGP